MKWISRCVLVLIVASIVSVPAFANQTTLIYGVENAKHIQGKSKQTYYIRAGSFKNKVNAKQYQMGLRAKTQYSVKFSYQNSFYIITVGPINSAANVRAAANTISDSKTAIAPKSSLKPVVLTKPAIKPIASPNLTPTLLPKPAVPALPEQHEIYKDHAMSAFKETVSKGKWVFTGGVGAQYPQFNARMNVNNDSGFPPPSNNDLYTTNQNYQPLVLASLAYRIKRDNQWLPAYALGLQYQHDFAANVGNNVLQYSLPEFYNYNYSWNIASDIFLLIAKINIFEYGLFSPYIHAGIGTSFNNAGNYSESPTAGVTERVSPGFSSYTSTHFAYSLGAGIDFQVTEQVIVSAQYQYQNLGNVKSANGNGTWSAQSLDLGTYSTNAVLLSVSYVI